MTVARRYALPRYLTTGFCVFSTLLALFVITAPARGAQETGWTTNRPARLAFSTSVNDYQDPVAMLKADDPTWNHGMAVSTGIDGEIYAACHYMGSLVIAGDFVHADGQLVNGIASFDNIEWSPLGAGVDGDIYSLFVIGDRLYAGGEFSEIGGVSAGNIAVWDGSAWSANMGAVNGPVFDIGSLDGNLAVVGAFSSIDGVPCNRFARYADSIWYDLGFNGTWSVETIHEDVVDDVRLLYIGGDKVATWDEVSNWTTYDVLGHVNDITRYRDVVVAGGYMGLIDGWPCNNAAAWNGSSWVDFGDPITDVYDPSYELLSLLVIDDALFAACRPAWQDAGIKIQAKNRVQKRGIESWAEVLAVRAVNGPVNTICCVGDSLIALGLFDGFYNTASNVVSGSASPNIAIIYDAIWYPYGISKTPLGFDGEVTSSTRSENGDMVVAGRFMSLDGGPAGGSAFFDGQTWSTPDKGPVDPFSFDPDFFLLNNYVSSDEALDPDFPALMSDIKANMHNVRGINACVEYKGSIYAAGDFYFPYDGASASGYSVSDGQISVARLMGASWTLAALNPFPPINDLVVFGDSLFLLSRTAASIACIDGDTGNFHRTVFPFAGGTAHGINFDERFYISAESGIYRHETGAANPNNDLWTPLGDAKMKNATFFDAGGVLWASPETGNTGIYRLYGNLWEKIYSTNGQVLAIEPYAGDLYISGNFTSFEGVATSGLIVLEDGAFQVPAASPTLSNGSIASVNILDVYHGSLLLGGDFKLIGDVQSPFMGRWNFDTDAPELTIAVHQNPFASRFVDIFLMGDDTPLLPTDMIFTVSGEPVLILPKDEEGNVWRAEYSLGIGINDFEISATAADYSWLIGSASVPFSTKSLNKAEGGVISSSDGVVSLNIAPDALEANQTFLLARSETRSTDAEKTSSRLSSDLPEDMIILSSAPARAGEYTYAISSDGTLDSAAELVFSLEGSGEPASWSITRGDGEVLDSYYDPRDNTVRAYTRTLGSFTLAYAAERPVTLLDDRFLRVSSAWPNPFNPQTRIEFEIKARGRVTAEVFDLKGRKVRTLFSGEKLPGTHELIWSGVGDNGDNVSSGIYMVRINAADQQVVRKITLLK